MQVTQLHEVICCASLRKFRTILMFACGVIGVTMIPVTPASAVTDLPGVNVPGQCPEGWNCDPQAPPSEDPGGGGGNPDVPVGGGTVGPANPMKNIPDQDGNKTNATCKSGVLARFQHAVYDVTQWHAKHIWSQFYSGMIVIVHYDDGGTEAWQVANPFFSVPLSPVPVPGTLNCPSGMA